jgi:hypothetical protein
MFERRAIERMNDRIRQFPHLVDKRKYLLITPSLCICFFS